MTKREKLQQRIKANEAKIQKLQEENQKLERTSATLSDKVAWYKESEETFGRGKNKITRLVGRQYWNQDFIDEDTGEVITIERSRPIKIDGVWQIG